jgi:hypothetical protein
MRSATVTTSGLSQPRASRRSQLAMCGNAMMTATPVSHCIVHALLAVHDNSLENQRAAT